MSRQISRPKTLSSSLHNAHSKLDLNINTRSHRHYSIPIHTSRNQHLISFPLCHFLLYFHSHFGVLYNSQLLLSYYKKIIIIKYWAAREASNLHSSYVYLRALSCYSSHLQRFLHSPCWISLPLFNLFLLSLSDPELKSKPYLLLWLCST